MSKCFSISMVPVILFFITSAYADPIDSDLIWSLIAEGKCSEARQMVEASTEAEVFLSSFNGKVLYAKSLCCSSATELAESDINNAIGYIASARNSSTAISEQTLQWLDDTIKQCEEIRISIADKNSLDEGEMLAAKTSSIIITSNYQGKIMSGCEAENLSPVLVPGTSSQNNVSRQYVTFDPEKEDEGLKPPDEYLRALVRDYVGGTPEISICAPYIVLSDTQSPKNICEDAQKFTNHFIRQYDSKRPPTWISIYHYSPDGKRIYEHAKKTTGEIRCDGVLGYYDWRRQSVIFRAPPGLFGTFHHELTHALLFWDIPLAPRWFEEGMAALYENTDNEYRGLENSWRERVLEKNNIDHIDMEVLKNKVLVTSLLEFEEYPVPATIAREYMRKVQRCGDLPNLYKTMRQRYRLRENLAECQIEPYMPPKKQTVDAWITIIDQYDGTNEATSGCQ